MTAEAAPARLDRTPAGVRLCALTDIAERGARGFVLQIGEARFHGFVVRRGPAVVGYVDRCPHMGFPLVQVLDAYQTPDGRLLQCAWHGALFEPEDGRCVGGPCLGASLTSWPVRTVDGEVLTA
jgi:nitrite reductase/ring-hydroxylating ferredoxin subunit